jgi:M6 family metalloprotease-like protein
VVFIRFSDDTEFDISTSENEALFNGMGFGANSLQSYYWQASYQQLQVISHFFPITTGIHIISYQDPRQRGYYLPFNSTTNPIGYTGGTSGNNRFNRERELAIGALAFVHDMIPLDLNIDSNNDGIVDDINFIIRGNSGDGILWPHRLTWGGSQGISIHGKDVRGWIINVENMSFDSHRGLGVLAHEFGHTLGLRDYYANGSSPIGGWCLMAHDRTPPQSMTSYIKWHHLGWIPDVPLITTTGRYTIFPQLTHQTNSSYRILSPHSTTEYYIVEYRSNNLVHFPIVTDSNLPGSGLLVYRVNTIAGDGNLNPPSELYAYRPGGTVSSDGTVNSAFYSLESGRTAINCTTNPIPFLSNGTNGGLNITDIGSAGATISFVVTIPGSVALTPPENLTARVNNLNVILNWDDPGVIVATTNYDQSFFLGNTSTTGYHVFRDSIQLTTHPILELTFTDPSLTEGTYTYEVVALYGTEESLPASIEVVVARPVFNPPTNLTAFPTNNTITLTWDVANEGSSGTLSGYRVFRNGVPITGIILEQFYEDIELINGTTYSYFVRARYVDPNGESENSNTASATPHALLPVQNLSNSIDEHTVVISWNAPNIIPTTLLGYRVYKGSTELTTGPIDTLSHIVYDILSGKHVFDVRVQYTGGVSEDRTTTAYVGFNPPTDLIALGMAQRVELSWEIPDIQPTLTISGFIIEKREKNNIVWNILANDLTSTQNTYTDDSVTVDIIYEYRVIAIYSDPTYLSDPSNVAEATPVLSDCDTVVLARKTELFVNFPNPFNPITSIKFEIGINTPSTSSHPSIEGNTHVRIDVYNVRGQRVRTLVNGIYENGTHSIVWNGTDDNGNAVGSGIYFYRMTTKEYSAVRRMILLK